MYRHELKYLINKYQFEILKVNLSAVMNIDENIKNKDGYFIRSLYFDDYKDTSYTQVIDGISKREKYRIRYYNNDSSYICLEKKNKTNNLGIKTKDILTVEEVEDIINNNNFKSDKPILNELLVGMKTALYKPIAIVDYNRYAFTYPIEDVRITLDYNISCSDEVNNFLEKNIRSFPLLEKDTAILEVKYNSFLPNFIKYLIDENLEVTSFSKYGNARLMLEKMKGSTK